MLQSFTDLKVWQKAHELTLEIYRLTKHFPPDEKFGLISQMRRCAVSVPSNLAEGFKKHSKKDSVNFYNISEGSLEELKYQVILARDLGYLTQDEFSILREKENEVGKMLFAWKRSQTT